MDLFNAAAKYVSQHTSDFTSQQLLTLYGLYKQHTEGACRLPRPSFFPTATTKKWKAWNNLGNLSKEEAGKQYIATLNEFCPSWRSWKQNSGTFSRGMSTLHNGHIEEQPVTVWDFVKCGDLEGLTRTLEQFRINDRDKGGLTLLHWACDRGYLRIVQYLLDVGADASITDKEGFTPMDYVKCCGYEDIAEYLNAR